jgi:alkyl hydroperoxide reductase subunit AhpC
MLFIKKTSKHQKVEQGAATKGRKQLFSKKEMSEYLQKLVVTDGYPIDFSFDCKNNIPF